MDFAELNKFLKSNGYYKEKTEASGFTEFSTAFTKQSETIVVKWQMGGYVWKMKTSEEYSFEEPTDFLKHFNK